MWSIVIYKMTITAMLSGIKYKVSILYIDRSITGNGPLIQMVIADSLKVK